MKLEKYKKEFKFLSGEKYEYFLILSTSLSGEKILKKMSDIGGWYLTGVNGNFYKMRKFKKILRGVK